MIVPDDRGPQKKLIIKSNETLPSHGRNKIIIYHKSVYVI